MTRDVRDLILDRLKDVVRVRGVASSARNLPTIADGASLPAVIVYDGTEEVREDPPGRPARTIQIVRMEVVVRITSQGDEDAIGTDINTLRLRLIDAITADTTIRALTLNGESPRYAGLATSWTQGRAVQGDMALRFSILYALSANDF